jgi:hypothetical protein
MRRAGVLAATAVVALSANAFAQGNRWQQQVQQQLTRAVVAFRAQQFARQEVSRQAALNNEESETFRVTLQAGVRYSFIGVCDVDCERLALTVSTATGNDLAVDQSSGALPIVAFTPTMTASYRVTARMAACRMSPCWYGVAVLRK